MTVSSPAASQMSPFDRAQTPADVLPASYRQALQEGQAWADPMVADSRMVLADDGQRSYLVPTMTGACVINDNESFCALERNLAGAAAVDLCSPTLPAGELELEWLMPDGATDITLRMSDGTTKAYPAGSNVYIARLPFGTGSLLPTEIEWETDGHAHAVPTPIPPGSQGTSCAHPASPPTIPSARITTTG